MPEVSAEVSIRVPIYPTEEVEKVISAVASIFPEASIDIKDTEITGKATSIERFKTLIQDQKIRSSARNVLRRGAGEGGISFSLNKQVAAVGKVNFAVESPLGDIEVYVETGDIEGFIDEIAPRPEGILNAKENSSMRNRR